MKALSTERSAPLSRHWYSCPHFGK